MIDRAWFEDKLAEALKRKGQAMANYNACEGAEQFCRLILAEYDARGPQSVETPAEVPASPSPDS